MNESHSRAESFFFLGLLTAGASLAMSCGPWLPTDAPSSGDPTQTGPIIGDDGRPIGWTEETHSNDVTPNYVVVFPENEVKRLDITIAPGDWQAMQDDLTAMLGEFGQGNGGGAPPPDGPPPPQGGVPGNPGVLPPPPGGPAPPPNGGPDGRPPGGNGPGFSDENPIWVPCTVQFGGNMWWYVGIRYKGQSSLRSTWAMGIAKLPLRFDFDEFEDAHPEIDDQRFFGFKKLSLASNFHDPSLLREKVGHDIFREAGVPAPRTAFYRVYVNSGEGATYFGLYTMTEIPDDPLLETQFGDDGGNLYKPTGPGATWVSFDAASFDKETNEDEGDWSDVQAAIAALHADRSDPAAWRAGLEAVFNVDGFLRWLAVNTVIQNWDTYGNMAQNYYLYGDAADDGRLHWIPWDNNEAFKSQGGTMRQALSLELAEVNANWPLIRYLADDPAYWAVYVSYVQETIEGAFAVAATQARFQAAHDLIAPYVVGPDGEQPGYTFLRQPQEFDTELGFLLNHVAQRSAAAQGFLRVTGGSAQKATAAGAHRW